MESKPLKLTPAHFKFIEKYAETGNATLAYRFAFPKATYSTARSEACDLLKRPEINVELEAKKQELAVKFDITKEKMINELTHNAEYFLSVGDHAGYSKLKDMIIKMFGFYAPQGVDVTSAGEKIVINLDLNNKDE